MKSCIHEVLIEAVRVLAEAEQRVPYNGFDIVEDVKVHEEASRVSRMASTAETVY
jgi:hypothetical protein